MARLNEQDREDLVAFLDGELDEASARQLEARLTLDPEARAEADELQQAWGLLDYLPRPEPSPSFTHRTLELLAVRTSSIRKSLWSRWRVPLAWAAAVLVAVAGGFGAAGLLWPARHAADPEFLRALEQPELFGDDADTHDEAAARATQVQARYAEWLDHLDAGERDQIKTAPDGPSRLRIIRDLREQEWLSRQAKKHRDEVALLKDEQRSKRIEELRKRERRRKQEWQIATRFWEDVLAEKNLPAQLEDLPADVQVYVNEYLREHLSREDQERLDKAHGWPRLPQTLVELADGHPMALLRPEAGPTRFVDLPKEVQKELRSFPFAKKAPKKEGPIPPTILEAEGAWPKFAMAVADYARKRKMVLPHELWPYGFKCLSPEMQGFVEKTLMPRLTERDKETLIRAESIGWPDYPRRIDELARSHQLSAPWQTLPGPRNVWDKYKVKKAG